MLAVVHRSICHGTPLDLWRMTKASTPIAATVSIVSRRLSPLLTLDEPAVNVITSAESRLAAVSNDSRVRVESSKNMLHTVRPRKRRDLRVGPGVDLDHVLGEVEEAMDGVDTDLGDRPEMFHLCVPRPRRPSLRSPATQAAVDRSLASARSLAPAECAPRRSHRMVISATLPLDPRRRSRRGWSAGSCRRSRGGSAARGGHGRRARRVARRAAARSRRARRGRRAPSAR